MSEQRHGETETVFAQPGGASRLPLLAGAGVGLALAVAIAVLLWPASEGRVVFQLDPPEAVVAILLPEGRRDLPSEGAAPTTVLEAGRHTAHVQAPGFEETTVEFEVVGGELHQIAVSLVPAVGSVVFEIEPSEARLEITAAEGGDALPLPLADGRWNGELEIGNYVARVSASGYQEESIPFAVSAEQPTLLPVSLREVARSSRRSRETVIVPAPGYYGPRYYGPRYYGPRRP